MDDKSISKVILIEDSLEAQAGIARAIKEAFNPNELSVCNCIREAEDAITAQTYDLALVDLGLPDGDGSDLISHFNSLPSPPISIVTTIFDDDRHIFFALKAGAEGYLLKDQTHEEIVNALKGIQEGRPALSPSVARRLLSHFRPIPDEEETHLTPRETEILGLIAKGFTVSEVSGAIGIKPNTVSGYIKEIYRKLHISSRAEAAVAALRLGIT